MEYFIEFHERMADEMYGRIRPLLPLDDFQDPQTVLEPLRGGVLSREHLRTAILLAHMVFGDAGPNKYGLSRSDYFHHLYDVNPHIFKLLYTAPLEAPAPIRILIAETNSHESVDFYLPGVYGYTSVIPLTAEGFWSYQTRQISQFEFRGDPKPGDSAFVNHIVPHAWAARHVQRLYVQAIFHLDRLAYFFPTPDASYSLKPSQRPDVRHNLNLLRRAMGNRVPGQDIFAHIAQFFPSITTREAGLCRDRIGDFAPIVIVETTTWWGARVMDRWQFRRIGESKERHPMWVMDFADDPLTMPRKQRELYNEILKNVLKARPSG